MNETQNCNLKSCSRLHLLLLLLIVLAGWWLRTDGIRWGLPFRLHPDEMKYVTGAALVHQGQWNPKYFRNPPGYSYLNAAWYPLWMYLRAPVEIPEWIEVNPTLSAPVNDIPSTYRYRPFDLVLGTRYLSALLGTLTIVMIYLIGIQLHSPKAGLIAAAVFAVSQISVRDSHFAVNDTAMTFFLMLTAWLGLRMLFGNARRTLWWAAMVAGVSVSMKYNAFPIIPALWGILLLQYYRSGQGIPWRRYILECVGSGVLALLVFLIIVPFPITDPGTFWAEITDLSDKAGKSWQGQEQNWSGFLLFRSIWISEGVVTSLLALAGVVLLCKEKKWEYLLFPLLYLLLVFTHELYLCVLPCLCYPGLLYLPRVQFSGLQIQ